MSWQKTPVPTPVPTPEPSVREGSPVLRAMLSPVGTPDLSEQPSPVQSPGDSQPVLPQPALPGLTTFFHPLLGQIHCRQR